MRTIQLLHALVLLLVLSSACTFRPVADVDDSPAALSQAFQAAHEQADESIGQPRSAVLWLDGQWVQFFDAARLVAPAARPTAVTVEPHAPDWPAQVPSDVLAMEPARQRANIAVAGLPTGVTRFHAAPLHPVTLTLTLADYAGPVELRLYDSQSRLVASRVAEVRNAPVDLAVLPRGAPGPQWALVMIDGRLAGARSAIFALDAETEVQTGWAELDALYPTVRSFLRHNVVSYTLDSEPVRGYRSPDNPLLWLRDHVYQGRGFRYFERDVTSLLDAFERAQRPDGSFPDVLAYPALGAEGQRMDPESDLEYLFVQGVYEAWQMTGDDDWLRGKLDAMRRGLAYITSDPLRWDAGLGLVRRPYTIDTWDFQYGPTTTSPDGKPAPRHWIDDQTIWGIFHGDNTGLAYAMKLMARIEEHLGNPDAARQWRDRSDALMQRLNALSWNGSFFTHFVPVDGPLVVPGVETNRQLSLSNAYALNREVLRFSQGVDIITTYYHRRDFNRAFAEWYSIDPPFPEGSFGMGGRKGERPGEYVNGGIMPLVGGELARGAFRYGAEAYGFDILARYAKMVELSGQSYLWYYPDDASPGISSLDTLATDGWGSSAMLGALMEGAAGIVDTGSLYRDVELSPRWPAAPRAIRTARVVARYGASEAYVAYVWRRMAQGIRLDVTGTWERAAIRLLLPAEAPDTVAVQVNGAPAVVEMEQRVSSRYARVEVAGGNAAIVVMWR